MPRAPTAWAGSTGTPPEMIQNLVGGQPVGTITAWTSPRPWCPWPAASWPPARPKVRPGVDAAAARAAYVKAYADEPFVHLLPEGQWPTHGRPSSARTPWRCRSPWTPDAGRLVVVAAVDNLTKGTAGGDDPVRQHRPRPARDPRPAPGGGSAPVSTHFSPRRVSRGRRTSPPGSSPHGDPDVATRRERRPRRRRRRPCSPPTGSRPRRCCGPGRSSTGGRVRAVVLNSGGANACTGPGGFQGHPRHRRARRLDPRAMGAGEVAVASTGLIGVRLPMDLLTAPGSPTRGRARLSRDAGRAGRRPGDHDHRLECPRRPVQRHGAVGRVGGWPRAPGCWHPALATMLVVLTTDAVVHRRRGARSPRCGTPTDGTPSSDVDSDGCLSTNDTVLGAGQRGRRGHPPRPRSSAPRWTPPAWDLAMQLLADAEGSHQGIAIHVRGAATRRRRA